MSSFSPSQVEVNVLSGCCARSCDCGADAGGGTRGPGKRPTLYFWAAEGRSSEEAVHFQGLQVELARARGEFCAGVLADLMKAYEHVLRDKLIAFARDIKFPFSLLRTCLACYTGQRRLIVDGQCTEAFSIGGKSLVAG